MLGDFTLLLTYPRKSRFANFIKVFLYSVLSYSLFMSVYSVPLGGFRNNIVFGVNAKNE